MAKRKIEIKLHLPKLNRTVSLNQPPQPDFVAITNGRVTSCRGCGESCPWGSLPGGLECTVQNDIDRRRRSRQN